MAQTFDDATNSKGWQLLPGGNELANNTTRLAETVALIQNSINEENLKLGELAKQFAGLMYTNDDSALRNILVDIAEKKGKIKAYEDCSALILDKMQG